MNSQILEYVKASRVSNTEIEPVIMKRIMTLLRPNAQDKCQQLIDETESIKHQINKAKKKKETLKRTLDKKKAQLTYLKQKR